MDDYECQEMLTTTSQMSNFQRVVLKRRILKCVYYIHCWYPKPTSYVRTTQYPFGLTGLEETAYGEKFVFLDSSEVEDSFLKGKICHILIITYRVLQG